MPISIQCDGCGKRLTVKDELIGKIIKCPGCQTKFKAEPTTAIKVKKQEKGPQAKVSISWGLVGMIAAGVLIPTAIAVIYFGPVRAKNEWDRISGQVETEIKDVLDRGLTGHMVATGMYNPNKPGNRPQIHTDTHHTAWQPMVMGMPEYVEFHGTTTEGGYKGKYYFDGGRVEAEMDIGGSSVPGTGEAKEGNEKIKVTGTSKDGNLSVKVNGKDATDISTAPQQISR
jgi:hypothetical protein